MAWILVESDSFNEIYREDNDKLIFKRPLSPNRKSLDDVDVWNKINPDLSPKAVVRTIQYDDQTLPGWVAPEIEGVQPTDEEIRDKLIDIFNRTGYIIPNAFAPGYFIKTADNKIVCANVDLAVKMENREEIFLLGLSRIKNDVNLGAWKKLEHNYQKEFAAAEKNYPKAVNTIKALFFTKAHRQGISNVDFLKNDTICKKLAQFYRDSSKIKEGVNLLHNACPPDFEDTQRQCVSVVRQYIESQGKLDKKNLSFKPFVSTQVLKSKVTIYKAFGLISEINRATSYKDLQKAIADLEKTLPKKEGKSINQNLREFFGVNKVSLRSALDRCKHLIKHAKKSTPDSKLDTLSDSSNDSTVDSNSDSSSDSTDSSPRH